jgi:hypothetical protein
MFRNDCVGAGSASTMTFLRVRDWNKHFENNRTRELKVLTWFPAPNRYDGDGYTELIDHKNGTAHYGAWLCILGVASKCEIRGTLLRDAAGGVKTPHDVRTLSRITRIPTCIFDEAIPRLLAIGWLEKVDCDSNQVDAGTQLTEMSQEGAAIPQETDGALRKSAYGMEGNGKNTKSAAFAASDIVIPSDLDTPEVRQSLTEWIAHKDALRKPYKSPDSAAKLFKRFEGKPPAEFVAAVDFSIGNNYQGLFAPTPDRFPGTPEPHTCKVPTDEELAAWNPYG